MTTVFLITASNNTPIIAFATERAAQQFCEKRPDLKYRPFNMPMSAGQEEAKQNLRDLFALKQELRGNPGALEKLTLSQAEQLSTIVEARWPTHQAILNRGVVAPDDHVIGLKPEDRGVSLK